jgi:hypothetical protein
MGSTGGPLTVCAQISPLARFAFEACGNGSGWLHADDVPDFAHFRVRFVVAQFQQRAVTYAFGGAVGFAELQSGADTPGFQFGEPNDPNPVEAAGPEASVGAQARIWLHERAYATVALDVGAAHVPGAPAVVGTAGPVVGFGTLTIGAGF